MADPQATLYSARMKVVPLKTFGQRLSDAMTEAGVTQAELSRKLNITPQAVHHWTKAKKPHEMTLDRWVSLSRLLNINLEWLAFGTGIRGRVDMDPIAFEVLRKFMMLGPDQRDIIITSIEIFLAKQSANFAEGNRR